MNRNRKGSKRRKQTIQPWTYEQARGVLPYLRSIVRSLREERLNALAENQKAAVLTARPGRPNRATLIAREEALRNTRAAEDRFEAALDELHVLDIYCLDPVRGEALVPFIHDEQLAWYVFDLFDDEPFRFWRLHSDPLETRRPRGEAQQGPAGTAQVA